MTKDQKKKEIVSIECMVLFFSFMMFVFAPLEFYLSNKKYFFFSGEEMLSFIFLFFISALICGTLIMLIMYHFCKNITKTIMGILFGLALAFYIQGNYIVVDYGVMDGRGIDWAAFRTEGIISVSVFLTVIIVCIFVVFKAKREIVFRGIKIISVCLILVQIVTLCTLLITKGGLHKEAEYVATEDGEFCLSKDDNILVLLLDTYDSSLFSSMLQDKEAEQYKDILADFTYYPDTVASYAATDLAIPCIITGEGYKNDKIYGQYLREAYEESPFLSKLKNENWYCGIYSTCMPPQGDIAKEVGNYVKMERTVSSHRRLAEFMYKFVGFRYLPQPLKKYCWFYPEEMKSAIECAADNTKTLYNDNNYYFYDRISEINGESDQKTFHLYHLDGTHAPYTIKSDFTGSDTEVGIAQEARGMMVLIDTFLSELKTKDLYDNSTVIIMADHGFYNIRQNPLFIVKSKNEKHNFVVSDSSVSYFDLQNAFIQLADGVSDKEVFNKKDRERIFCSYSWDYDMGEDSYSAEITEYKINGKAWNNKDYRSTDISYSAKDNK